LPNNAKICHVLTGDCTYGVLFNYKGAIPIASDNKLLHRIRTS
jgi:hypothetical protein